LLRWPAIARQEPRSQPIALTASCSKTSLAVELLSKSHRHASIVSYPTFLDEVQTAEQQSRVDDWEQFFREKSQRRSRRERRKRLITVLIAIATAGTVLGAAILVSYRWM